MNVDEYVLFAARSKHLPSLAEMASVLAEYTRFLEALRVSPVEDPAVLILGAFISFHTHADINSLEGYTRLITACETRLLQRATKQ